MPPSPILPSLTLARISNSTPGLLTTTSFAPVSPSTKAGKSDKTEPEDKLLDKEKYVVVASLMNLGGMGMRESEVGISRPLDPDPNGDETMLKAPGNSWWRSPSPVTECK